MVANPPSARCVTFPLPVLTSLTAQLSHQILASRITLTTVGAHFFDFLDFKHSWKGDLIGGVTYESDAVMYLFSASEPSVFECSMW